MQPSGAGGFNVAAEAYDNFMGRYSTPLATQFVSFVGVGSTDQVLDVGCGPGALTAELVRLVGAANVVACDPSRPFAAACARRNPGVDVRTGAAEHLPFDDGSVDAALSELVLHFVGDPPAAAAEQARVLRAGGISAAVVWDFDELWAGFDQGIGPAGSYLKALSAPSQQAVRAALFDRVGPGPFTMTALARAAKGHPPR